MGSHCWLCGGGVSVWPTLLVLWSFHLSLFLCLSVWGHCLAQLRCRPTVLKVWPPPSQLQESSNRGHKKDTSWWINTLSRTVIRCVPHCVSKGPDEIPSSHCPYVLLLYFPSLLPHTLTLLLGTTSQGTMFTQRCTRAPLWDGASNEMRDEQYSGDRARANRYIIYKGWPKWETWQTFAN